TVPRVALVCQNSQRALRMAHTGGKPTRRPHTDEVLKHLGTGTNLVALLVFGEMNQLQVLGVRVADDLMTALVHRFHRLGITMDAKRVSIKGRLDAVLVQDAQDAPDPRPSAVIVL